MTNQTTPFIVTEYNPVDAALAELRDKYAGVLFPVETKEGMKDAKEVRSKLTKLRTGLEKLRKEIKEPALRRTQAIDAEAKMIEKAIRAIEEPIDEQIKAEEQRIENEKAAKAAREADIKAKIEGIRTLPRELALASSDEIGAESAALVAFIPPEEVFGEFTDECKAAIAECVAALAELFDKALAREQAAAAVAAEQARLTAEREAFEAEKAAYEAEKALFESQRAAAAAPVAAPSGAETEPVAEGWHEAEQTFVMPVVEVTAQEAAQVFSEAKPEAPAFVATFPIRQLALATADQFNALASKVAVVGFASFADELTHVADMLRTGNHDAALAAADSEALIAADNLMLDATVAAIEAISDEQQAAA